MAWITFLNDKKNHNRYIRIGNKTFRLAKDLKKRIERNRNNNAQHDLMLFLDGVYATRFLGIVRYRGSFNEKYLVLKLK